MTKKPMKRLVKKVKTVSHQMRQKEHATMAKKLQKWGAAIDKLNVKQQAARVKLKELKGSSTDAWHDLRTGAVKAFADLKGSIQKAKTEFN